MMSLLDPGFLVFYASVAAALWFAIAARRRGCPPSLTALGTLTFFNGVLIAALGVGHIIAVVSLALSRSGPNDAFAYDFRLYALVQLGMLLIAGGVSYVSSVRGLMRDEPFAWRVALWASVALLAVNLPLIPVQGLALTPFLFVNLAALIITRRRFGSVGPSLYASTESSSTDPEGSRDSTTVARA